MARPLVFREALFVLTPCALLGGFAWYMRRVDQVSASNARGMSIANFKVEPETKGYYQSLGYTHTVTFTVDHPWPRPRWWGTQDDTKGVCQVTGNPLRADGDELPTTSPYLRYPLDLENTILSGHTITTGKNGSNLHEWKPEENSCRFEDGHYVFKVRINLTQIPPKAGEVTYHGLCRIAGQPSLHINKAIRARGEKTQVALNKDTGGYSLTTSVNPMMTFVNSPKKTCYVNFFIAHPQFTNGEKFRIRDYDYVVTDAKGKRMTIEMQQGKPISYGGGQISQESPTLSKYYIGVNFTPNCTMTFPMTLSGKISLDEHWPITFKAKLYGK